MISVIIIIIIITIVMFMVISSSSRTPQKRVVDRVALKLDLAAVFRTLQPETNHTEEVQLGCPGFGFGGYDMIEYIVYRALYTVVLHPAMLDFRKWSF